MSPKKVGKIDSLKPRTPFGARAARKAPPPTKGQIVRRLMLERKVRGNVKDFMVLHGALMMDYEGTYELHWNRDGSKANIEPVLLVHKRELAKVMVPEVARLFWNPSLGVRVGSRARKGRLPERIAHEAVERVAGEQAPEERDPSVDQGNPQPAADDHSQGSGVHLAGDGRPAGDHAGGEGADAVCEVTGGTA